MEDFTIFLNHKKHTFDFLLDDTIEVIQMKIAEQLDLKYSDIYLYIKKQKKYEVDTFDHLRKHKSEIQFRDIYPFLSNILEKFDEMDYDYDSFLSLNLDQYHLTNICLSHTYNQFIVDPFHKYSSDLSIKDAPIIINKSILLNYLPFKELHIITKDKVDPTIRPYYFIYDKQPDIQIHNIDYLYEEPKESFKQYISNISGKLQSITKFIPLEIVFKNLHATSDVPIIKYNPGLNREKIYRLYGNQLSTQYTTIPILTKSDINNYHRILAKTTMISAVILKNKQECIVNLMDDGNITFELNYIHIDNFSMIETLLKDVINPFIFIVNSIITMNGYLYPIIHKLDEVEIIGMKYNAVFETTNNLLKQLKCMSSIFYLGDNEFLYKRISNFNINGSIQKYISLLEGYSDTNIISLLMENKNLSEKNATDELKIYKMNRQLEEGTFRTILNQQPNSGFPLELNEEKDTTIISIRDINHIAYLNVITVYINGLYRMVLNKLNSQKQSYLCDMKQEKESIHNKNYKQFTQQLLTLDIDLDDSDSDESYDSDESLEIEFEDLDFDEDFKGGNIRVKNITTEPYAQDRLMKRDPELFLKKAQGKHLAYARFCQSHVERQPMVLTNEEMEQIKKKYPNTEFGHVLNYGSNGNQHNYMCPRYWCMKKGEERPLTQKDIDKGDHGCGKLISRDKDGNLLEKKDDENILSFEKGHFDDKGNYIQHFPGLSPSHPNPNLCIPCCFKKDFNSKHMKDNLEKCKNLSVNSTEPIKKQYIVNYDKIPEEGRLGYLPLPLQKLFNIENKLSELDNTETLLSVGVNHNDSFMASIAYLYGITVNKMITSQDMRQIIADNLTINNFMNYENILEEFFNK